MAEKIKFVCEEPAVLLFSSITQKSAPKGVQTAEPKYSGTFGLTKHDWDRIIPVMVQAITSEMGQFSGNPNDYYLACMSGNNAANRVMQKAEYDAGILRSKGENDKAFQLVEKATKRADEYRKHAGILSASSKYDIELARLEGGAIKDIIGDAARAQAGKDFFYSGGIVVPSIALQGFRRKKLEDRDGVTAYLQNCLYIRKGPKLDLGGGTASNGEVFSGFQNYSDYDPLANAPGGGDNWNTGGQSQGNGQGAGQSQGAGSNAGGNQGQGSGSTTQSHSNQGGDAWGNAGQQNNGGQQQNNGQGQQGGGYQPQGGYQGGSTQDAQW